ncbi:multicopper oxidase domain-containing protein [Candidatus Methylocalor cossyra]|uniref:Multicopper oxidase n=1 Tax=Candidatus Methylocalor cossyra TaxID=3108543 RepID=A0ABP1CAQ6_9GAMM
MSDISFPWLRALPFRIALLWLVLATGAYAEAVSPSGDLHQITLRAVSLPSGQLAYQMVRHQIRSPDGATSDVTSRYAQGPTIPGPTLVMREGDRAEVTLEHGISGSSQPVSIHVHGVHYKNEDDGTLKILNRRVDSAAFPGKPYTYTWTAAPGTAGTWPYHDHAFGNPMLGSEDKGLFGTLIVNPADGKVNAMIDGKNVLVDLKDVKREFVLWMHETTFWGMEINHLANGKQFPLWTNPTLGARQGEKIRFHVLGMGTAFHTFHLHGHRWLTPGTTELIDTVNIGPLSRHAFVVEAGEGVGPGEWHYHCHVAQHMQSGMMGDFRVVP